MFLRSLARRSDKLTTCDAFVDFYIRICHNKGIASEGRYRWDSDFYPPGLFFHGSERMKLRKLNQPAIISVFYLQKLI